MNNIDISTASVKEIANLLIDIADELGVRRNDHISEVESYASRANEGDLLLSDAAGFIKNSLSLAENLDKAADLLYDASNAVIGCL